MTTYLAMENEADKEYIRKKIKTLEEEIASKLEHLTFLKSALTSTDLSSQPMNNPTHGAAIDNLGDREALLKFFHEHMSVRQYDDHVKGRSGCIFWSYTNVPSLCDATGLECPDWFVKKYIM